MVLFHVAFGLPFAIFLLRNFFAAIPRELLEAARMDGASEFTIFSRVILPLGAAGDRLAGIFQFLWVWNDLLVALIFANSKHPADHGRAAAAGRQFGNNIDVLAPGAFVSLVIPLAVFFAFQRYFVQGDGRLGQVTPTTRADRPGPGAFEVRAGVDGYPAEPRGRFGVRAVRWLVAQSPRTWQGRCWPAPAPSARHGGTPWPLRPWGSLRTSAVQARTGSGAEPQGARLRAVVASRAVPRAPGGVGAGPHRHPQPVMGVPPGPQGLGGV